MMNDVLYNMIFKRKSFHLFNAIGAEKLTQREVDKIYRIYGTLKPLDNSIRTAIKIVPAKETNCRTGQQYCVMMYSEKKGDYLRNIGYLGQQLDLYMVSQNIGTLWYGLGKTEEKSYDGLDYVIMFAIAKVDDEKKFRKDMFKSKRKAVSDTWVGEQIPGVTDIARFAPSACNSQPWLVEREGDSLSVYRCRKPGKVGILMGEKVPYYNRIDMGIYLCILELCLKHEGISYEAAYYSDPGGESLKTLNAVYKLRR